MNTTPESYYRTTIDTCRVTIASLNRKGYAVAMLRLAVFILTVVGVVMLWGNMLPALAAFLCGTVLFLALARRSGSIDSHRLSERAKLNWAEQSLRRLNLDLKDMPDGREFVNPSHDYTFDIDIFGNKSIFALLDSTSTPFGHNRLAEWLMDPPTKATEIRQRQEAIAELAASPDLLRTMASVGRVASDEIKTKEVVTGETPDFSINKLQKAAVAIVPFAYIVLFVLYALGLIPGFAVFDFFIIVLLAGSLQARRITRLHKWITDVAGRIACCTEMLHTIETAQFASPLLRQLQESICNNGSPASILFRRLARSINNLDQRYNVFGYAIMNGFLLWDWKQIDKIGKWMAANGRKIGVWRETIADVDALGALATFAFAHPDYVRPKIDATGNIIIEAENAGHPLIPASACVTNSVSALHPGSFFVITGANMAGKSTYLRTVAVNYLLALTGAPVFASKMTFTPTSLITGLRTSDSLADGASYFFAELTRLQRIVQRAEQGERLFVILDEILRGTNSDDKQKGTTGLVSKLVGLSATGIIATHDLSIGKLAQTFPGKVENFRFEAEIGNGTLSFSYCIRPGIARNANASYLMKSMGII